MRIVAIAIMAVMTLSNYQGRSIAVESVYTDLSANKCKTIEIDEEVGYSKQLCEGVGGYKLIVVDADSRANVTVVDPAGEEHLLNFQLISPTFSTVGEKAEWRVVKNSNKLVPIALIIRFNISDNPDDTNKVTSYLTVSKITREAICLVDKIKPGAKANEQARIAADNAGGKSCLE